MYKRQIEGCGVRKIVFDMKQKEFMDSSGIGAIIGRTKKLKYFNDISVSVCNMSDRVDTVSYTHLDVYKRQVCL